VKAAKAKKNKSSFSSQYKGVCWSKRYSKWQANIRYNGKRHHLGYFDDEGEAARARDRAAETHLPFWEEKNFP
jgi:hypothetical protein